MIGSTERGPQRGGHGSEIPSLDDREASILSELARDPDARVAFQGLRRRLGIHQESLSRSLRRLERGGLLARERGGYRLTEGGTAALRGKPAEQSGRPMRALLEAIPPPGMSAEGVVEALAGRWFRGLRWYGRSRDVHGTTLTWLSDPGNHPVRIRVVPGRLILEAAELQGDPSALHAAAARSLFAALGELFAMAMPAAVDAFTPSHATPVAFWHT